MTERRHPLAECENCEWNVPEAGFADATGPEDAEILVVGESPGRSEARTGIPFTGITGKLLDITVKNYGWDRSSLRLTNAVACHPPYEPGMGSTEPPRSVIEACAPRLASELEDRSGVLCMGNTAQRAILGDWKTGILKVRKEPPKELNGAIVVSTIHPAACLRVPDHFPSFKKDIRKLKRALSDGDDNIYTSYEPPRYAAYDDVESAEMVLKKLMEFDILTLDIETGVEKDESFLHPRKLLCIGFGYGPNKAVVLGERCIKDPKIKRMIKELLNAKKIICHNGKFDLQVLMYMGYVDEPRLYADTMLASYVLDERPGNHGLKPLSSEWLGAPDYDSEIKKYIKSGDSYDLIPKKVLYKYNAYDCAFTYNLWLIFEKEMDETLRTLHDRLCGISTNLIFVESGGVKVDEDYMDALTDEYIEILDSLDDSLSQWVDNPRSVPQVKAALTILGLPAETTERDTLERLFAMQSERKPAHQFLKLLLEQRREQKLYGTYVKGIRKRLFDGMLYPTYLVHGTTSGRLSCRNPNLQNVPRESKIKRLLVPREGNSFVQCDYSQAELRVIACLAKDPYLHDVFNDDSRDIHGELADVLFGKGKWNKEDRVRAKSYVFGSLYGLSPYTIALDYDIPELQATREQNAFFRLVPHTMKWRRDVHHQLFKEGKVLETHFGRRRRFELIVPDNKDKLGKEAWAFPPQSTANDICLSALGRIRKSLAGQADIRITVHDSIMAECEDGIREDVGREMARMMEETAAEVFSDFVPFKADAEYGKSWGDLE